MAADGDFDFFDCHLKKLHMAPSFVNPESANTKGIWNQQIQRNTSEASTRASAGSDNTPTGSREASRASGHATPPSYAAQNMPMPAPMVVHNPMPVPAANRPQSPSKSRPAAAPSPHPSPQHSLHQGGQDTSNTWVPYKTPEGREYYHCKATGQTVWEVPPGGRVVRNGGEDASNTARQHHQEQQHHQHMQAQQHALEQHQRSPARNPSQEQHQQHLQEQHLHTPTRHLSQASGRHLSQEHTPMSSQQAHLAQKPVQEGVCARCNRASESHFDHVCPVCNTIICISCLDDLRMIIDHWKCPHCQNEEESRATLRAELWAISTYRNASRLWAKFTGSPAPQTSPGGPGPAPVANAGPPLERWGPANPATNRPSPVAASPVWNPPPAASQHDGYPAGPGGAGVAQTPGTRILPGYAPDAESFVKILGTGNHQPVAQSSSSYQPQGALPATHHQAAQSSDPAQPERTTRPPMQWPIGWAEAATSLFGGNSSSQVKPSAEAAQHPQSSNRSPTQPEGGIRWAGGSQKPEGATAAHQTRPPANWSRR